MLRLFRRKLFDRDLRRMQKRGKKLSKLWDIVEQILKEEPLSARVRNHKLKGSYSA